MIGVIGFQKLAILLVLIVANVGLATGIYVYLAPEKTQLETEHTKLKRQLRVVQSDIDRMKVEFEQLDAQQDRFDALKNSGFFSVQERSQARVLFSEIQADSNVISAVVSVNSGIVEDDVEAEKAEHKILISPIEVEIRAFDDNDVYRYIEMAQTRFPGHLSLNSIEIYRIKDVSSAVLRSISAGANPEMIQARLSLTWRTLIPESQIIDGSVAR